MRYLILFLSMFAIGCGGGGGGASAVQVSGPGTSPESPRANPTLPFTVEEVVSSSGYKMKVSVIEVAEKVETSNGYRIEGVINE